MPDELLAKRRKTGSTTLPVVLKQSPTPRNQFSFSRLKTFHQCPLRYRYRYLAGRREAFRSLETFLGSTLHSVLEWLYDRREHGESPSLESALEELARRWREDWTQDIAVVRIGGSAEDAFRAAREMLALFHRSTFARDRSETVALEQRFSEPLSDDMYFSGVADRIGRTDGGRLFVVDYKTSRSPGTPEEFSEGLQAQLYAGCALRRRDESEALAGYHYLRLGSTSWHLVSRPRAEQLLGRFAELARTARDAAEFPARPGVLCAWCGFNAICPQSRVPVELSGGLDLARAQGPESPPPEG
jgi:RecB family exonuclease